MAGKYRHWKLETDGDNILWLSLDKEGATANVLSADVMAELDRILDELSAKTPRGVVIRSGKDSGFIAGADVEEFTKLKDADDVMRMVKRGWDLYDKLASLPFPTLALVNGFCMGGGVELALACRYRVAVDQPGTRFALPEVMLGILPAWGGVKRLPRLVGPTAALDMLLTGRSVDARRAKRLGLVDEAVPPRVQENAARMIVLESPRARRLPLMQALMNSAPLRPLVAWMARRQVASRAARQIGNSGCARPVDSRRRRRRSPPGGRRHRGDLRESAGQARTVREARSAGEAGGAPRHEYVKPQARRHRREIQEPVAPRGNPFLQPGAADAAGRSGQRQGHRRGDRETGGGFRASDRQIAAAGQGFTGLSRQPRTRPLHRPAVAHGGRRRRARGDRRGGHGIRHADGAHRAGRHGGPGHLPRGGQGIGGRMGRTPRG